MSIQIDLPPEWEARVREEAAEQGQDAGEFLSNLLKRQLVLRELEAFKDRTPPQSLADLKPRIPTPPGTTWLEAIRGQWPGDETDEQVAKALAEMSDSMLAGPALYLPDTPIFVHYVRDDASPPAAGVTPAEDAVQAVG